MRAGGHSVKVRIRGRRGSWSSRGTAPRSIAAPPPPAGAKIDGRHPDGHPHPQAFSLVVIQSYPTRTATCRRCEHLVTAVKCSRATCGKMTSSHATLLNAIADGDCPVGLFTKEL